MKTVIVVLFTVMLFCSCGNKGVRLGGDNTKKSHPCQIPEECTASFADGLLSDGENGTPFGDTCDDILPDSLVKQGEDSAKECLPCQIPEKCIALLAYGLLSDDGNDMRLGEACEGIISDTLVMFLQVQKRIFKQWQSIGRFKRGEPINQADRELSWTYAGKSDIHLLPLLISTRVYMEYDVNYKEWWLNADLIEGYIDHSFVRRIYMIGNTRRSTSSRFDNSNGIVSFNDFVVYLDSLFIKYPFHSYGDVPLHYWCERVKRHASALKKHSSGEDFLLKYYDLRCNAEDSTVTEDSTLVAKQRDGNATECPPCSLSGTCIALLAYGLLSNDEQDVPFGGTCKDIAPDSLVEYLRLQKRIFKRWEKTKEIDTNDIKLGTAYAGEKDIGLLQSLILDRIRKGSGIGNKPRK